MHSLPAPEAHSWFAVRTRSNFERQIATGLEQRGYQHFLPSYRSLRRWSDRIKETEAPLFPGYVFCRFHPANRLPILQVPGVAGIAGIGNTPEAIPEREIEAIRTALNSDVNVQPWPFANVGDRVVVCAGPLIGMEGILKEYKGGYRIVLSVALMQRSVAVEVERDWVRPALDSLGRSTEANRRAC